MKKLFLFLALLAAIPASGKAKATGEQPAGIIEMTGDEYYDLKHYSDMSQVTSITINSSMLKLAAQTGMIDSKLGFDADIFKKLKRVRIIAGEDKEYLKAYEKDMETVKASDRYEEMAQVTDEDTDMRVFAHPKGENVGEMLVFVKTGDESVILQLIGDITPEMIADIANSAKK